MAVLGEIRRVPRPGGQCALVTALGDGARLEAVSYDPDRQRWFFYRDPGQLTQQLQAARLELLDAAGETRVA